MSVLTTRESAPTQWLELFFDLVFVASLALLNNVVLSRPMALTLVESAIATATLLTIWLVVTLMNAWYPADDSWRRIAILVVMGGLMLAGLSIDPDVGLGYQAGQLGIAAALVSLISIFFRARREPGAPSSVFTFAILISCVGVALCVVAANIDATSEVEYGFVLVTTLLFLVPVNALYRHQRHSDARLEERHLTERVGQLALITLGEGFTLLAVNMQQPNAEPDLRFFLLTFVLAFLLWRLFFDGVLRGNGQFLHWRTAVVGQYLLLLGIVWMFDILTMLSAFSNDEATRWDNIQFAVAGSITFLGFALLTFARVARVDARTWLHVVVGAMNILAVTVIVLTGVGIRVTAVVAIVLVAADSLLSVRLATTRTAPAAEAA